MTIDYVQPAVPRKWYQIWLDIWQHPGTTPFMALLNEPNHASMRGFIWIALTSLIVGLISGFSSSNSTRALAPEFSSNIIYYLCLVVVTPIFGVLGLIITTGIFHGIARLLGGQGTWSDLVICMAAVAAPSELIGGVIGLITILLFQAPILVFIPWAVSFLVGIYAIVLNINALKAAEKMETGRAVLTYFIPVIIVVLLAICAILALVPAFVNTGS